MDNEKVEGLRVNIVDSTLDPLKAMWIAARNCYFKGGFDELNKLYVNETAVKLIKNIRKMGHTSIFEQAHFQFIIEGASRSLLAQLTRHRVGWSYAVQSQHYQNHKDFHFKDLEKYADDEHKKKYYKLMDDINDFYKDSLKKNIPIYIAREVLPNSTSVHLVASANLRALDHFWKLRAGKNNTPEIRKLSKMMYDEVVKRMPQLKEIIEYPYKEEKKVDISNVELNMKEYEKVVSECKSLAIMKNADYGCKSLEKHGNRGILTRISDKVDRLDNFYFNGRELKVKNEKVEDTLKDLINYSIYMIMQERGKLKK